jgi:surface polysaccharide O-acyltransferase-like enzyme
MVSQEGATLAPARKEAGRDIGFDVIRVMASVMVVVIHVSASLFYRFEAGWVAANFYDSLSRSAVPLFFMISGALLVPRDSDQSSIIRRGGQDGRAARLRLLCLFALVDI